MNINLHHIHAIIAEHGFLTFSNGMHEVRIIGEHIAEGDNADDNSGADYHIYRVVPSAGCNYDHPHRRFTGKLNLGRAMEHALKILPARV